MLLLSYPTPQIAGQRFREFEKHPEWKAGAMDRWLELSWMLRNAPKAALRHLLSAELSHGVRKLPKRENPGDMILAICILAGALMVASLVLGLCFRRTSAATWK